MVIRIRGRLDVSFLLFIQLLDSWSNRMAVLFLCYHSTALCTYKADICASAICYFGRFIYQFLLYRQDFIGFCCYFGGLPCSLLLFLSTPFAATRSQQTTRRQLTVIMSILSFRSLRITVVVDRLLVLKLGIINQSVVIRFLCMLFVLRSDNQLVYICCNVSYSYLILNIFKNI